MLRGLKAQTLCTLTLFYVLLMRNEPQSYASAEDKSEAGSTSPPYILNHHDERTLSESLFTSKPQKTQVVTISRTEQNTATSDDSLRSEKAHEPQDDRWLTSTIHDSPLTIDININSSEQWERNSTRRATSSSEEFPDGTGKGSWNELTVYKDHDSRRGKSYPMTTEASTSYHKAPDVTVHVTSYLLLLSVLRID
ncbi:uncharacterized protein LOC143248275 [Tachypleus tridentatus]|uniref:uncharacterized protein LOC143248275 n=1 Tax=Tachypleus tridentatus TaxID=6853 RepID=UPI003FD0E948